MKFNIIKSNLRNNLIYPYIINQYKTKTYRYFLRAIPIKNKEGLYL